MTEYVCSWCGAHHDSRDPLDRCPGVKEAEDWIGRLVDYTIGGFEVDPEDDPPPIPRAVPPTSVIEQRRYQGRMNRRPGPRRDEA